jgi:integrase
MGKKRGNGEGSISKRKDGRWCAVITNGNDPNTGKPKRVFFYGKTRQEVAEKLNQALHSIGQGTFVEPSRLTVGEWINTWLFEYKKQSLRPTTFQSYEYLTRVHVKPTIGHIILKDLRSEHLQRLYNEKATQGRSDGKGGLSPKTVRHIHCVIHEALEQALKNNLVVRNVSKATTLPRQVKKEMKVLTVDEQCKLLNVLGEERLRSAFILALASGVREGELLAIRWQDIDLKEGIINIRQSLKRVKVFDENKNTKSELLFQEPKTKAGKRIIPLPASVITELKEHRNRQLQEKLKARLIYEDNDLVFCTEIGKPIDTNNLIRKFKALLKKAGMRDINFHALRHTYATRLLEANEHPKVVQEILGHSDISMTLNTYSHVMPEIKKAAAQKLDHLFQIKNPSTREGSL